MSTTLWHDVTSNTVAERFTDRLKHIGRWLAPRGVKETPPAEHGRNDLGWLSLCQNDDLHTPGHELCRLGLVYERDPNMSSPDPFLSDEAWAEIVASRRRD